MQRGINKRVLLVLVVMAFCVSGAKNDDILFGGVVKDLDANGKEDDKKIAKLEKDLYTIEATLELMLKDVTNYVDVLEARIEELEREDKMESTIRKEDMEEKGNPYNVVCDKCGSRDISCDTSGGEPGPPEVKMSEYSNVYCRPAIHYITRHKFKCNKCNYEITVER